MDRHIPYRRPIHCYKIAFYLFSDSVAVAEPYVVVWDVRYLRGKKKMRSEAEATWTIQTASPPLLLHFLPAFSGRAVALSGDGHVALLHVNSGNDEQSVFQVCLVYVAHSL